MRKSLFYLGVLLVGCGGSGNNTPPAQVVEDPYTWQERLTGLPNVLNAVTVNTVQSGFIAVGNGGTIMTSDDGLTWNNQVSGTSVDLNFVTCYRSNSGMGIPARCFAAGGAGTILATSTDGSGTWTTWFDGPDNVSLNFFYWRHLSGFAVGTVVTTDVPCILQGNFLYGPWTMVEPLAQSGLYITDLAIRAQDTEDPLVRQYIAAVEAPFPEQAKVLVSNDLLTWVEVFVSDDHGSTYSIMDSWVSGSSGKMYASDDGINWTQYQTPATQSNLVAMASRAGILMAHGFSESIGMGEQVGVATSDDGATWQMFVIGAAYEPRGLAYNNRRWVSVGQTLAEPGRGAIFTTQ